MSRAFRDTFKQTFCLCQKIDHRQSRISFAQVTYRKKHVKPPVTYQAVSTCKSSSDNQTNLPPMIKRSSNSSNKKKKRTSKAFKFLNHTNSSRL